MSKSELNTAKFLLYKNGDTDISINVIIANDTIWATQKSIAQLFGKSVSTISRHISNVYETHELNKSTTIAKFATVVNISV